MEEKMNILNEKIIFCSQQNFKLLRKIEGNSINN
jgi:hypothetical protein